ncbi:MAG: toprim domain-containing protein [Bacillota bacterium]
MGDREPGRSPEEEGRALVESLGGRWTPAGGLCRCPAHDDRTPSLSVRPGRTRLLLHCFAGCSAKEVLRALDREHLLEPNAPAPSVAAVHDDHRLSAAAQRIWNESRSLQGTAAEFYLAARGLRTASPELRFNALTPHGRHPLTRHRPALIAAIRDDAGLTGIHRTFLDHGAQGSGPRKCGLGRFGRGAVRLGGIGPALGIAEGIETALSATALFGVPCWATLGTERFGIVALPSETQEVMLFLDHDPGGRRAEALAREAFGHITRVTAHYPPRPGTDWNDVLRTAADRQANGRGEEARRG